MNVDKLVITYADPNNLNDSLDLSYKIRNHSVANKWIKLVSIANEKYSIDDPGRFLGFGDKQTQINVALDRINKSINTINNFSPIIKKRLHNIDDQDTLNYLHHIFEVNHGLLNQQNSEFWNDSPEEVRSALANLNINVHECEAVGRSPHSPTHCITWFKMPKLLKLSEAEYSLLEFGMKFGTVNLLYAEIGKTLLELAVDNDNYIFDEAFQPFKHISADFFVTFYSDTEEYINTTLTKIKQYYESHRSFFEERNLPWGHHYLRPGYIPLADLIDAPTNVIELLESKQWVKSIKFL